MLVHYKEIHVREAYQMGYQYPLLAHTGNDFAVDFQPDLTPKQMLHLGVFGGDYFPEVSNEFPTDWFDGVELSGGSGAVASRNLFKVNASQPLAEWQRKGWIYEEDPLGWFFVVLSLLHGSTNPRRRHKAVNAGEICGGIFRSCKRIT